MKYGERRDFLLGEVMLFLRVPSSGPSQQEGRALRKMFRRTMHAAHQLPLFLCL